LWGGIEKIGKEGQGDLRGFRCRGARLERPKGNVLGSPRVAIAGRMSQLVTGRVKEEKRTHA